MWLLMQEILFFRRKKRNAIYTYQEMSERMTCGDTSDILSDTSFNEAPRSTRSDIHSDISFNEAPRISVMPKISKYQTKLRE